MSESNHNSQSEALLPIEVEEIVEVLTDQVFETVSTGETAFVGIYTRGVTLAKRVADKLKARGQTVEVGALDISLYRDDLDIARLPELKSTEIPFSIDEARVILFDDVLYTGRTIRAALDVLSDYGRPSKIELAVLVDRGWRELPIQADYIGKKIETEQNERVGVKLKEEDGEDGVFIKKNPLD